MARKKEAVGALDDAKGFIEKLQEEAPRVAVIIAAAYLDGWLRRLLEAVMVDEPRIVGQLLGGGDAPKAALEDFSDRIKAAYCLNLLTKTEYDDLNTIRKIRNLCAHRLHDFSFDDQEVQDRCNSLTSPMAVISVSAHIPKDYRFRFLLCVTMIATQLQARVLDIGFRRQARPKMGDPLWESRRSDPPNTPTS